MWRSRWSRSLASSRSPVSYSRNQAYVTQVAAKMAALHDVPALPAGTSLERCCRVWMPCVRSTMPRTVIESGAPWAMRWGLYQGDSLGDAARDAYGRELDEAMLPTVAARFRQRMIEYASEPEKLYQYLKGVSDAGASGASRQAATRISGRSGMAVGVRGGSGSRCKPSRNISAAYSSTRTRFVPSRSMTPSSRRRAARCSRRRRPDSSIDTSGSSTPTTRRAHCASICRGTRRRTGAQAQEPCQPRRASPSIYTKTVFEEITDNEDRDSSSSSRTNTGCGATRAPSITQFAALSAEFLDVYEKDYIAAWDRIVNDIQAAPLSSLADTKEALEILSAPTSPLRGLLEGRRRQHLLW